MSTLPRPASPLPSPSRPAASPAPAPADHTSVLEGPAQTAALDALLQPLDRADAPGLVLGVARHGRTVYQRGVGLACVELGVPMTPRTRVRIASTSKHFTALGVMLLAEDGKLGLDDLVYQHLPELPVLHPAGPTLRQLMQHTGGWRTDLGALAQGLALEPLADWRQPLQVWDRGLNFEPGTRMVYSNSGYRLLALLIQRVSGLAFEDFLKQRIFDPLGMRDTESLASDVEIRPGLALQYLSMPGLARPDGQPGPVLHRGLYPGELRGGGSLISNLDDMLRWLAHLRSPHKQVGTADTWAQMLAPTRLSTGMEQPYTLGLMRHDYRGVEVIHHAGAVLGATSQMITVPAHGLDIMVMANGAPVSTVALAYQVIDTLLGDAGPTGGVLGPRARRLPSASHAALLGQRYHARETGALLSFEDVGGQLGLAWMAGRPTLLRVDGEEAVLPCEDTALNTVSLPLAALATADGQAPDEILLSDGGHRLRCQRLPATDAHLANLATLAAELGGHYLLPDLGPGVNAQVRLEDGQLLMRLQGAYGRNALRLQPLAPDLLLALPLDPLTGAVGGGLVVHAERPGGPGDTGSGLARGLAKAPVVALRLDAARVRQVRLLRVPGSA